MLFKKEESEREYLDHVAALQKEIAALEAKNKAYGIRGGGVGGMSRSRTSTLPPSLAIVMSSCL